MNVVVPADPAVAVRPLPRAAYDELIAGGRFADERVELLEGVLVRMPPMSDRHARAIALLTRWLARGLPDALMIRPQLPIAASEFSEPEPDISVVDFQPGAAGHPTTAHLAIEVCLTTQRTALVIKPPIYAAAGVAQYWVVDLAARRAVLHAEPVDGAYTSMVEAGPEAVLSYEGVEVALEQLWEPPAGPSAHGIPTATH